MKKRLFRWAAVAAAAALCLSAWGCAPAEKDIDVPGQNAPTPPAQTEGAFRMTQEGSVRNEKFRERKEFAGFIGRAESKFLIAGLNQAMTPQGISYSGETGLAYITSYAITDTPSAITGVSLDTGELTAEADRKSTRLSTTCLTRTAPPLPATWGGSRRWGIPSMCPPSWTPTGATAWPCCPWTSCPPPAAMT